MSDQKKLCLIAKQLSPLGSVADAFINFYLQQLYTARTGLST